MAGVTVDAAPVRAEIEAACERAGRDPAAVTLLAAVKYLAPDDLGALTAAGIEVAGENRAQALEEKAALHPELRWHFIGQLQSRKVKQILPLAELVHSVASESVLEQLGRHGTPDTRVLIQVNVAGEDGKAGVAPGELADFIARCPVTVSGLMTMPPAAARPEDSRPHFRRLAELAAEHGLHELSMGTSQDFGVAVEEGATIVRVGSRLYSRDARQD
ncbi:MAG: dependent protein [Solirubrobacteraceae bacterium]|nr:dependent protein [Solirubrobacteraceae bacterium]